MAEPEAPFIRTKVASFADVRGKKVELHAAFVGDAQVGKTAFVESLLFDSRPSLYFPTILDMYSATGSLEFHTIEMLRFRKMMKYRLWVTDTPGMCFLNCVLVLYS